MDIQGVAAPALNLVSASGDNTLFHTLATFSMSVDPVTATNVSNYLLTNSLGQIITIGSVTLQSDGRTVLLSTPLQNNTNIYTLLASNVLTIFKDRAVTPGSDVSYMNTVPVPCTLGQLTCEIYYDIMGSPPVVNNNLSSLTNNSNFINRTPGALVYPTNFGFSFGNYTPYYGTRIFGYFIAPSNGLYRF